MDADRIFTTPRLEMEKLSGATVKIYSQKSRLKKSGVQNLMFTNKEKCWVCKKIMPPKIGPSTRMSKRKQLDENMIVSLI